MHWLHSAMLSGTRIDIIPTFQWCEDFYRTHSSWISEDYWGNWQSHIPVPKCSMSSSWVVYECSVILIPVSLLLVLVTMLNCFFVNAMCYCRGNYLTYFNKLLLFSSVDSTTSQMEKYFSVCYFSHCIIWKALLVQLHSINACIFY